LPAHAAIIRLVLLCDPVLSQSFHVVASGEVFPEVVSLDVGINGLNVSNEPSELIGRNFGVPLD